MKRDKMKKKGNKRYKVWFLGFTLILYCRFHQNNMIFMQQYGPKGCKLACQVDRYHFSTLGPSQKVVD
jgi:hypothetical protein